VLAPILATIAKMAAADPAFQAEATIDIDSFTCYTGQVLQALKFQSAWRFAPTDNLPAAAAEALRNGGQAAELGHYSFCTNGSYTAGVAKLPTVGYGPGFEATAHTTDEYLDLEQLFGATEGYYALAGMKN
jgi:acetylornithine deacetylase/succinyl-diaminopimelate desuccinylase-like protein